MALTSQSGKLLTLALTACPAQNAHATLIQLTGLNDLSATDAVLMFPDADGSMYSNSVAYNATGKNTPTFSGDSMIRSDGDFMVGMVQASPCRIITMDYDNEGNVLKKMIGPKNH